MNPRGTGVALVTPFSPDSNNIDEDALARLLDHIIQGGVNYAVLLGTTGEAPTVSKEERQRLIPLCAEIIHGRIPLVVGFGGNNTKAATQLINSSDFSKVDAVLSATPYYNKPQQSGLLSHYKALAEACPKPIILYNIPSRTGCLMEAATTLELAKDSQFIAVKEASGDMDIFMDLYAHKPEGFTLLSGDDAQTLTMLGLGFDGVISVIGNAYPRNFSTMVDKALEGDFATARELHYKLLPLMRSLFEEGNPAGIKALLAKMGICDRSVRLPLDEISESLRLDIESWAENVPDEV